MRGAMLSALALLALASVAMATDRQLRGITAQPMWKLMFPPYQCIKNMEVSPFILNPVFTDLGGKVCFTVMTKTPTLKNACNEMDFHKLELDVDPNCKRAVKSFTVNGVEGVVAPTYEDYGNGKALVKLPSLGLDMDNADGAEICIFLDKSCPSIRQLCNQADGGMCKYAIMKSAQCNCCPVGPVFDYPSPPPPTFPLLAKVFPRPPPLPFPFCKCNHTSGIQPYVIADVVASKVGRDNLYTFTLDTVEPIDPSNKCANSDLYKIEFWSSLTCHRAISTAYVNGIKVTPGWDNMAGIWKITNLNMDPSSAKGTTIQLRLDASGPCPDLKTLCNRQGGKCVYSTFNEERDCCPVGYNLPAL